MSSAKNKLQEYYQKNQLVLPTYTTLIDTLTLKWQSTVILSNGENFIGEMLSNKTNAEISAAEKALNWLSEHHSFPRDDCNSDANSSNKNIITLVNSIKNEPLQMSNFKTKSQIGIFIDVENLPKIVDQIIATPYDNIKIYAYVGIHHPQSEILDKIHDKRLIKILSPSTRQNGTDMCMQMNLGIFLYQELYDQYIICTRDNFGGTLTEFIKSNGMLWKPKSAVLASNIKHIIDVLDSAGPF